MGNIEQSLAVVDSAGNVVWQVDGTGERDGSGRYLTALSHTRDRITATPLAAYMVTIVEGEWVVHAVNAKCSVTGGSGCAVDVLTCSGVTAPGSGVTQLTGTIALTATAPFSVNGVLIATPTRLQPGDSVARVISGTVGSVEGVLTIWLKRVR